MDMASRNARTRTAGAAVATVALLLAACQGEAPSVAPTSGSASSAQRSWSRTAGQGVVKTYDNLSQKHQESGFSYPQQPPVGGAHHPVWANCGVYDRQIKPQHAVHSLEHGAVWITYRSSLPKAQITSLEQTATKQGSYLLVSVLDRQSAPIVLTAWGKQLKVSSADDPTIDAFIRDYRQGPQTPEPGASCTGGYDPAPGSEV